MVDCRGSSLGVALRRPRVDDEMTSVGPAFATRDQDGPADAERKEGGDGAPSATHRERTEPKSAARDRGRDEVMGGLGGAVVAQA